MNKYDNQYEAIKNLLIHSENLPTLKETWILTIEESMGISRDVCVSIIDDLIEAGVVVEVANVLYIIDNKRYMVGALRVVRASFGFVGDKSYSIYIKSSDYNTALDKDIVLVQRVSNNDADYGVVIKVLKRERKYILGTFVTKYRRLVFEPYENKYPYNFDIKGEKVKDQRILVAIDNVENGTVYGHVHSILGLADEPGIDVLSVLEVHDLETGFSQEALDQAESIEEGLDDSALEGRMDHRNQNVITIDGEDAKDLDDAIYLERRHEGYRLYVHIADVSYYVTPGCPLDEDAARKTSSIYLVDRVVPMLPKKLSNGVCSLHPKVDRLTLTCMMDFDLKGNVDNYAVYPSLIQSKRRMSYNEINLNDSWGPETEMIQDMLHLAEILHYKRQQAGAIDFESDEAKFVVDHEGVVLDIVRRTQGEAEAMIEAFMVSANETVARYCRYLELPIMYRTHEKPDTEKMRSLSHTLRILGYVMKGSLDKIHPKTLQKAMDRFKDKPEGPVVSRLMIRSMSKARYDQEPLGHFGLALEDYAHFTSPIRRYPDLWLHQCLRKYVFNHDYSSFDFDVKVVKEHADHVSSKERDILDAERDVEKIKKAQYMVDKYHQSFDGLISGFSNYGIFVELDNTVEGIVPFSTMDDHMVTDKASQKAHGLHTNVTYALGQKLKIRVERVNLKEHEVEFSIQKGRKKREKYRKKQKSIS